MAKYAGEGQDPYLDPDTGILRNRLAIQDQATLDKVESGFSFLRAQEMKDAPVKGAFDHLQNIHKRLFGDVYAWAGELRQVNMTKGQTRFAYAHAIESAAKPVFTQLARENYLLDRAADEFSRRVGYYLGEINVLHPFREGNGRTQREFIGLLAHEVGYHIAWSGMSRDAMVRASMLAYHGDPTAMAALIHDNLHDRTATYSLNESRRSLDLTAHHRGLIVRDADTLRQDFQGEVMATSSRHALVQVSDLLAVCYQKDQLNRDVQIGEKLAIRHSNDQHQVYEQGKEPVREQGRGLER